MAASYSPSAVENGPREMYKVKPFYDDNMKMDTPNIMYRVKNIHADTASTEMTDTDPVSALERKQESILSRLSDIKQMLDKLTDQYNPSQASPGTSVTGKPSSSSSSSSPPSHGPGLGTVPQTAVMLGAAASPFGGVIHDIVISADPASPPLSLFALYEALRNHLPTLATSYVHSSMKDVDPRLCDVIKTGSQVNRGNHVVALSLVWKKVDNGPVLMVSPSKQCLVQGEVNIARYLNRIINPGFDTDDIITATQIDEWLDIASQQLLNGNTKEKAAAMRNLNSRLGRNDWLVGSTFSLADIVTWSAVHQSQQADSASANVKKWLKACAENPLLQTAISFL